MLVRLRPGRRAWGAAAAGQRKVGGSWHGGTTVTRQLEIVRSRRSSRGRAVATRMSAWEKGEGASAAPSGRAGAVRGASGRL